jgi:hypothetical protein
MTPTQLWASLRMARPEGGHFRFAVGQPAFIERADIGVMADGDEGRHRELAPHPRRAGCRPLGLIAPTGTRLMRAGDDTQLGDKRGRRSNPLAVR